MKFRTLGLLLALTLTSLTSLAAQAQEADTAGILDKMPPSYKLKVVRPGESRTSEFFFTGEIAGSGTTAALVSDKASHAGRFAGVKVYCVTIDSIVCDVPAFTKNGTPITDGLELSGGMSATIPFSEILTIDTSDSMSLNGSVVTSGTSGSEPARVVWEFYTPRHFQYVAGQD